MQNVVSLIEYDKISDNLMYLGSSVNVKFNVKLAKKGIDGKRYHFFKEYQYDSEYINFNTVKSIKRDFEYFISIESQKDKSYFCMITINDILLLRAYLKEASKWLDGSINTFAIKRKKLVLLGQFDPLSIQLCTGKVLSFEPVVITDINDKQTQGIRLSIDSQYIDINAHNFFGFVYLMNSINMYESAQLLVQYIPNDIFGTNTYNFSTEEATSEIKTKTGRFPPEQPSGGSFFSNKLDDM